MGIVGLAALRDRYDAVNIKLDKTGGLTAALAVAAEAERLGFAIMVGCMVGSSLAMAPALLLAGRARFVDLDGPLTPRPRPAGGIALRGLDLDPRWPGAVGVAKSGRVVYERASMTLTGVRLGACMLSLPRESVPDRV